jgi:ribonucleoside-diphosphate reductase beta chain
MAFMPYCSLPELESAMNVWQLMEMIHSRSYTYIIKNVYPDASEVFDNVLDDPKIMSRAESVTKAYDDLINSEHDMIFGSSRTLSKTSLASGYTFLII